MPFLNSPVVYHRWLRLLAALGLVGMVLGACASGGSGNRDMVTAADDSDARKRARIHLELAVAYFRRAKPRSRSMHSSKASRRTRACSRRTICVALFICA